MYLLSPTNIGKQITFYRKKKKISLEELGRAISKSKATISKYEKGTILPDILTLLEICNTLNINISQILPKGVENETTGNPFNANTLYLYYITSKKIITSILELESNESGISAFFYNDIKKSKNDCAYFYTGYVETDKSTINISLNNRNMNTNKLECVYIVTCIPWNQNFKMCKYFLLGLTPNGLPVVKKGLISNHRLSLDELKEVMDNLTISKEETKKILADNMWTLEHKNYFEF